MAIIGFNYSKIEAVKKKAAAGSIKINNNAKITGIKQTKASLGTSEQKVLVVDYEFTASYEPGIAAITCQGSVVLTESEGIIKKVLDEWKKDKKVSEEIGAPILNHVLTKCSIQALILSKEMSLPPPIKLPKLAVPVKKAKK